MVEGLVSVIIPIYNSERYLERCIKSVLNQSYNNIEIILINDGSTDLSGQICKDYITKDKRIRLIEQANRGPSAARNRGLEVLEGELVLFVDSDDYIDGRMIESLVKEIQASKVDLVISGYKKIYYIEEEIDNIVFSHMYEKIKLAKDEFFNRFHDYFGNYYINYLWNKVYLSSIIKKNKIKFDEEIGWGEDLIFNLNYIDKIKGVSLIDESYYNYTCSNEDSITSKYSKDLFFYQKKMYLETRKILEGNQVFIAKNKEVFRQKYIRGIMLCINNLFHLDANLDIGQLKTKTNRIIEDNMTKEYITDFIPRGKEQEIMTKFIKYKLVDNLIEYKSKCKI
ncbi:MAG: glycosyltransferase family 2 protein [Tissierellaceae bacterium]